MTSVAKISIEMLREAISYDADSGVLTWLHRPISHFCSNRICRSVNSACAGRPALHYVTHHGYRIGTLFQRKVSAHQAAFAIMTGRWAKEIDHINGDRSDNRWVNLREVTRSENCRNIKKPKNNTSGSIGIRWNRGMGRWVAYVGSDGDQVHLGSFASKTDAIAARSEAEAKYGFHENHGREQEVVGA